MRLIKLQPKISEQNHHRKDQTIIDIAPDIRTIHIHGGLDDAGNIRPKQTGVLRPQKLFRQPDPGIEHIIQLLHITAQRMAIEKKRQHKG